MPRTGVRSQRQPPLCTACAGARLHACTVSGAGADRHRGVGLEDAEAEALLEIEPHDIGVMAEVPNGQILVPTPE